ncbi:MAG: hypothetical protein WB985_05145 [Candidatus Acidiferrales bacterium]
MTQRKFHPRALKLFLVAAAFASLSAPRLFAQHDVRSNVPASRREHKEKRAPSSAPASISTTAPSPLHFQISAPKTTYRVGELIPLDLTFSADTPAAFRIYTNPFDRVPLGIIDTFVLEPEGAVQPRSSALDAGLPNADDRNPNDTDPLKSSPAHIQVRLNEWFLLNQPATFRLQIESDRIVADVGPSAIPPPFHLASNAIEVRIISADAVWQAEQLKDIRQILDTTKPLESELEESPRAEAVQRLRYLDTDASAREIVQRLGEGHFLENETFSSALFESSHKVAAIDEMNRLIDDRDFPVTTEFADLLAALPIEGAFERTVMERRFQENENDIAARLFAALRVKRGKAFTTTFATAEAIRHNNGSNELASDAAVRELVHQFAGLTADERRTWLGDNWNEVRGPEWIETVREISMTYRGATGVTPTPDEDSQAATAAVALQRWLELDPDNARDAILSEITSRDPHFTAGTLNLLPEDTLTPAQQHQIAENFLRAATPESASIQAELLYRYADTSIWPDISDRVSQTLTSLDCTSREQMLALALRADPGSAEPLLEAALASRDGDSGNCAASLLTDVASLHNDPSLEKLAIASLDDSDARVVQGAATYLGAHGSADAEDPLWQHFETWAAAWAARDRRQSEQNAAGNQMESLELGTALGHALVSGPGWLADRGKLVRIRSLSGDAPPQQMVSDGLMALWNHPPLAIRCMPAGDGAQGSFDFWIAQYAIHGTKSLQDKLGQFPSGTTLFWDGSTCSDSSGYGSVFSTVTSSASLDGITLQVAPVPDSALRQQLDGEYAKWLNESVSWIGPGPAANRIVVVQ